MTQRRKPQFRMGAYAHTRIRPLMVGAMLLGIAAGASGQQVKTGLTRDTIRVGDPFRAVISITVPRGTDAVLPDSLAATEDIENAGKVRITRDTANGALMLLAAYPLTAWRPGSLKLPDLPIVLRTTRGERHVAIKLPMVPVVSVLPADTAGIKPKPPKDVLGGNRLWWPWILAGLLLLIALIALWWWWRRRRRNRIAEPVAIPAIMPRARALEELERIRALHLAERGDMKEFYTRVSEVLRQYVATVEPKYGTDLTTDELARKAGRGSEITPAIRILRNADMVKFARGQAAPADATADLDRARDFVRDYPPPVVVAAPEGKAA